MFSYHNNHNVTMNLKFLDTQYNAVITFRFDGRVIQRKDADRMAYSVSDNQTGRSSLISVYNIKYLLLKP